MTSSKSNSPTFQDLILRLQTFWAERGCVLQQPYDVEVGAGTMAPETFLRVLGPKRYKVAYVQPSRRPADGRYGENPNRLYKHMQLQVILKPPPDDVQDLYLESLGAMGIDLRQHDIKFEEDNWESPTLGAWGIGWQVMLDGLEITQFTYFQQCGGLDLVPISAELTYGLERIAAFLQDVDSIYEIVWARDPEAGSVTTYGDVRLADEVQFSVYNFEIADIEKTWEHFELCEAECKALLERYAAFSKDRAGGGIAPERKRFPLLAAYDLCLKCSHLFNILDARGAISVTERVGVIARVRVLAVGIAKAWVDQQKSGVISDEDKQEEEKPTAKRLKTEKVSAIS
ncbi:MAG TPA: glycine--tRNA ligase subunit alpha [Terriglobales bacterium]|nr:glycine--tRNA ligase subunit alpha [Terriglobales bacterium]